MSTKRSEDFRFLIAEFCVKPALVNLAMGALVTWLIYRSMSFVPFWGGQGIAVDLVITTVIVTVLTDPITRRLVRVHVGRGRLQSFQSAKWRQVPVRHLPSNPVLRPLSLALANVVTLTLPVILACSALGFQGALLGRFLALKSRLHGRSGHRRRSGLRRSHFGRRITPRAEGIRTEMIATR